jgi:hypothetical protein
MSGQPYAPAALTTEKDSPVPIRWEVWWIPEPVWSTWKSQNSLPYRDSNSDPSVVKPIASRYTD